MSGFKNESGDVGVKVVIKVWEKGCEGAGRSVLWPSAKAEACQLWSKAKAEGAGGEEVVLVWR